MKYATRKSIRNILGKSDKSRIDLPQIKFEKIINDDNISLVKNKIDKKRKSNISLSESKNMNRTSIKFIKNNSNNMSNFNINNNLMMISSKRFSKFKNFKDK